jgi:predicted secreted protein
LDTPRETFIEEHFVQAHLLKRVEGELVMLCPHSSTIIVLPCPELGLYQVKNFTLNLASEDDVETIRPS